MVKGTLQVDVRCFSYQDRYGKDASQVCESSAGVRPLFISLSEAQKIDASSNAHALECDRRTDCPSTSPLSLSSQNNASRREVAKDHTRGMARGRQSKQSSGHEQVVRDSTRNAEGDDASKKSQEATPSRLHSHDCKRLASSGARKPGELARIRTSLAPFQKYTYE